MDGNSLVSLTQLQALCYTLKGRQACGQYVAPLNAAMQRYQINTPQRLTMFLAQIAHESADFTRVTENLNYSAQGLADTWPSRFALNPVAKVKAPNPKALKLVGQPEAIANCAYSDRYGNGSEASGDGWLYRGAGLKQLTFRANHEEFGRVVGIALDKVPDYLRTPEGAALSAAWFWWSRKLNAVADTGDFAETTQIINGGQTGAAGRAGYLVRVQQIFQL